MRQRLSPWILLVCAFLLFFTMYLTGAVWPEYLASRGFRQGSLGLILGLYGLALFVARVPIGFLSDFLVGRRRTVISAGFLCIALGFVLPGLFGSIWPLFATRILMGIGAGSFVATTVLFTLYFPPRSARFSIAIAVSFFGWGQIIANPLGGWLADSFGMLMPFWITAIVAIVGAVLALIIIEPDSEGRPASRALIIRRPTLYAMATLMAIVFFVVYATVYNITQVYASSELGITGIMQGLLLTTYISVFVGVVLGCNYFDKKYGSTNVIAAGMCFLGAGVILTPVANLQLLFLCEALTGVGLGLTFGLLMALGVEDIPTGQRFYAMGLFQSVYATGMLLGPVTAGYSAQSLGLDVTFYLIGSVIVLIGVSFLFAWRKISITSNPAPDAHRV